MSRYLLGETAAIFISYKDPNRLEYDKIIDSVKSNPISCLFYWSTGIPELVTNCVRFSPNRTNVWLVKIYFQILALTSLIVHILKYTVISDWLKTSQIKKICEVLNQFMSYLPIMDSGRTWLPDVSWWMVSVWEVCNFSFVQSLPLLSRELRDRRPTMHAGCQSTMEKGGQGCQI